MEIFIDKLRRQRNLILHRSSSSNKKHDKISGKCSIKNIKEIFVKSKNCIEIMNYTMELN